MADLSVVTRRAFLAALAAGAVTLAVPNVAAAKPLEELTASNFAQKVYHNPKPVVVLFYEAGDGVALRGESTVDYSQRMERVVETLADKYGRQVTFFKVALDHNTLSKEAYQRVFGVPDTSPLTVMYGRFDVLSGAQHLHNTQIDVREGGPRDDTFISANLANLDYWIQQNFFRRSPDGDRKLYRYEGTSKIHEVGELR